MHTCPLEGPGWGPAGRWGCLQPRAKSFCQGCLHQLHLLLHCLKPPAPRAAGPPEPGPHLGKGQEAVSMSHPPPPTHLGKA